MVENNYSVKPREKVLKELHMSSEINQDGKMIKGVTTLKELHTPNELFFSVERFQRSE